MADMQAGSRVCRNEFYLDFFCCIGLSAAEFIGLRLNLIQYSKTQVCVKEEVNETRASNFCFTDVCNFRQGRQNFFG